MGRKKKEEQPGAAETERPAETEQVKSAPEMAEAETRTPRSAGRKRAEKKAEKADQRVTTTDPVKKEHMEGHRNRLRDRYREDGMDSLQDYEVLELLLQFAMPHRDTKEMAKQLIAHFGSLPEVLDASYDEILDANIPRVKDTAATLITLFKDTENRYHKSKGREHSYIRSTLDAGKVCCSMYHNQTDESVRILCLNARGKIVKRDEVAKGDVNAVHFPVRKIVETAVLSKAVSVILTHNHPGGTLSPSREDLDATEAAKAALSTIGVRLLDHLIVSGEDYYSLRENGYL